MYTAYIKYLENAINNWYRNAKIDYNVNGRFVSASVSEDTLSIVWEEEGQKFKVSYRWFTDFTPEQIYNIWMEEDDENIEVVA